MNTNVIFRLILSILVITTGFMIYINYLFRNNQLFLMLIIIGISSWLLYLIRCLEYNNIDLDQLYINNLLIDDNYKIKEQMDDCIICYDSKRYYVKFNCNHYMCRDCIIYGKIKICPLCRKHININDQLYIINNL